LYCNQPKGHADLEYCHQSTKIITCWRS